MKKTNCCRNWKAGLLDLEKAINLKSPLRYQHRDWYVGQENTEIDRKEDWSKLLRQGLKTGQFIVVFNNKKSNSNNSYSQFWAN